MVGREGLEPSTPDGTGPGTRRNLSGAFDDVSADVLRAVIDFLQACIDADVIRSSW
jgi:hypothetical protein